MPRSDGVPRRFQDARGYQIQTARIFRARKEDCGIPKPPAFPQRGRDQCCEPLLDDELMTSNSSTHSSGCCDRDAQHRVIITSKETTRSRPTTSAGHDQRAGSEFQTGRPIENTVRTALLSGNASEGGHKPVPARLNQKPVAAEPMSRARSGQVLPAKPEDFGGFSDACQTRSVPSRPRFSTALGGTSSRYQRQSGGSCSAASCFDLIHNDLPSSENQSETMETENEIGTFPGSRRALSTPLGSSPAREENMESSGRNLHRENANSIQTSPKALRASNCRRSESPWDAASLAASFMDDLSLQLIDTGDLMEHASTREQCPGRTGELGPWPALDVGDRQQPRTAAQLESDLEERLAAWDPSQEDCYELSVTGELELLEQELFDPRRPRTPVETRDFTATPLTRTPAGTGTLSTALRRCKTPTAAEDSPDTSIYDDLEWITEESGTRLPGWTSTVNYTTGKPLAGPEPTVDAKAWRPVAIHADRQASCSEREPAASRSGARTLPDDNIDRSSVTSSTSLGCFPGCEDPFIKPDTCSTSVDAEVVWKSSELLYEDASILDEDNDASLGVGGSGVLGNDEAGLQPSASTRFSARDARPATSGSRS
ncbi:hypothetical protein MTO96_047487 [Rhipicephalus appendiculatus]